MSEIYREKQIGIFDLQKDQEFHHNTSSPLDGYVTAVKAGRYPVYHVEHNRFGRWVEYWEIRYAGTRVYESHTNRVFDSYSTEVLRPMTPDTYSNTYKTLSYLISSAEGIDWGLGRLGKLTFTDDCKPIL
jgi:hypothetical protein